MYRRPVTVVASVLVALLAGSVLASASPAVPSAINAASQAKTGNLVPSVNAPAGPVGSGFTYQGRLSGGGSPVTGNYDFQFTLYDALTGGNVVSGPFNVINIAVTNGLFSVVFHPVPDAAVDAFLDELSLFGMGASWGGFESLAIPITGKTLRVGPASRAGPCRGAARLAAPTCPAPPVRKCYPLGEKSSTTFPLPPLQGVISPFNCALLKR